MGVEEPRPDEDNRLRGGGLRPERLEEKAIWRPLESEEDNEALTVNTEQAFSPSTQVGGSQ